MKKEKILIAVKTYPVLSKKYTELACTAGFKEDGSWVRIYPIPFRLLKINNRFRKYQWIELSLIKNRKDPRPESYKPYNIDDIKLLNTVRTDNNWAERRKLILENNKIYTDLSELIYLANNDNKLSLAIFKPAKIIDFIAEQTSREWDKSILQALNMQLKQGNLFEDKEIERIKEEFKIMPKLPYKFSYRFIDQADTESTMIIEDWEIGQLYWNCVKNYSKKEALLKVKEKYFNDFANNKDLYLFLGTTRQFHGWAKNPFVIIGTFHPPFDRQLDLF
jgi:hypothetical protein